MQNIIEINDFDAPELDVYARLTEAQLLNRHEPHKGLFIAESPKVIERALDAGCIPVSILLERKHIDGQAKDIIARCSDIPVYTADFDILTQITGFKLTRGALCVMHRPALPSIEDICSGARRIAILENVMNPTNVGAIFRSAAALNIDAVLLTPSCSNPLYRRAIRVSMGTVFQIPWTFLGNEANGSYKSVDANDTYGVYNLVNDNDICETFDFINDSSSSYVDELHKLGFKTAAMALSEDSVSIDNPELMAEEKLAIILGTEGDGLANTTIEKCDYTVCIPMSHGVDSLNVAAASAVAFWQLGNK